MKVEIVYKNNNPNIYIDDKKIDFVRGYSVSQSVNEPQILHLDIVLLEPINIRYEVEQ